MPCGNGTGPNGMGSGTGRAMGYCSGSDAPGFASAPGRGGLRFENGQGVAARGCGRRRGGAGCRGAWRQAPMAATTAVPKADVRHSDTEGQDWQQQTRAVQTTLDAIMQRLSKLESARPQG